MRRTLQIAILAAGLVLCGSAHAQCTLNKANLPTSSTGASPTSFTITSTTGNEIIVGIIINTGDTVSAVAGVVSGSSYTQRFAQTSTGGKGNVYLYDLIGATTGETGIKVTHTGTGVSIVAYDITGPASFAFDMKTTAAETTNASNPGLNVTAAATPCFAASVLASGNSASAVASPFTIDNMDGTHVTNAAKAAHEVNSTAGSTTVTFTDSTDQWCIGLASWKYTASASCAPELASIGVGAC